MAGECLSYGAFGAYSTRYHRAHPPLPCSVGRQRLTDSWTNFLPDVKQPDTRDEWSQWNKLNDTYDHEEQAGIKDFNPEVTWVVKRYTPLDERPYAPVPRFKYLVRPNTVPPPSHWIPPRLDSDPEAAKFARIREEQRPYGTSSYTRDERWSTLRETLPSRGYPIRTHPPDWGTNSSIAPNMTGLPQRRFPIIDSPMSRFVSNMHLTNREFRLF